MTAKAIVQMYTVTRVLCDILFSQLWPRDKLVHWEHTNQTKWHNSFLEDTSYTPPLTVGRKHSLLCERLVTEEEGFTRGTLVNGFRLVSKLVSKLASPQALVREPGNEASVEV